MRLRLGEILKENERKGVEPSTADQLARKSKGRLSMATAARLARDEWKVLPRDVLITLCEVLEVGPNDEYLRHVLRVHEADIRRFNPDFVHDPFSGDPSYLVLKGDAMVGVVLMRDLGDGRAQLLLDYVTPPYRDLSPGEFVFGPDGPFRSRGFRRVLMPPGMVDPYYERLGFTKDGDAYVL